MIGGQSPVLKRPWFQLAYCRIEYPWADENRLRDDHAHTVTSNRILLRFTALNIKLNIHGAQSSPGLEWGKVLRGLKDLQKISGTAAGPPGRAGLCSSHRSFLTADGLCKPENLCSPARMAANILEGERDAQRVLAGHNLPACTARLARSANAACTVGEVHLSDSSWTDVIFCMGWTRNERRLRQLLLPCLVHCQEPAVTQVHLTAGVRRRGWHPSATLASDLVDTNTSTSHGDSVRPEEALRRSRGFAI